MIYITAVAVLRSSVVIRHSCCHMLV